MTDLSDRLGGGSPQPPGGGQPGGGRPPQQPQLSKEEIQNMEEERCGACGNTTFTEALQLKVVPSVHPKSPPGDDDAIQPVKTLACVSCGEPKTMSQTKK